MNEAVSLKPGDTVIGSFRVEDATADLDRRHSLGNGIYLLAYPKGEIYHRVSTKLPWYGYPAYLALSIKQMLHEIFPADTLAFAQGLLLGDTSLLDYETDMALKLSGIRHIVAVSGLHVSILFAMVQFLARKRRWLSALIGIPVLVFFAAVAGFSPSITRACIMHGLMLVGSLFEKEYDGPTALSFALLPMLLVNPYAVCSVSLQLSAGCMSGILMFANPIGGWLMHEKHFGRFKGRAAKYCSWFSGSISVSVSATVITIPLCAMYFGTVSLVSVITNLLTLWVVNFIFYGIIVCCALGAVFLPLGIGTAWIISWPIRYVLVLARFLGNLPLTAVYTASIYIVLWLVFCYVLLAVYLCMKEKKPLVLSALAALGLCISLAASWCEPIADDVRMTVLDVGQGQCIILQSDGKTYLVDCGGSSDTRTADTAAQQLLSMGISRLDGVILTHYDRDHVGALANLLSRIDADILYLPDCADEEGYSADLLGLDNGFLVSEHMEISFDDTSILLISTDFGTTNNESGLCVLFQRNDCDILITGDRNIYGERDLLRQIELPNLEVLIVGHHGSKYSTGEELLEAGRPDIAIISVGENSYGHPAKEVLDRLTKYGCEIYTTLENGTIIYRR